MGFRRCHPDDTAKQDAIRTIATLDPRRIVIGAAMYFGDRAPDDPEYGPQIVYPATVGDMLGWLTDAGFAVTAVERLNEYSGVLVAERRPGR